jgi:hypothetical protein
MTDLSPAAQAVLDAVAAQMEGKWISPDFLPYECKKLAAALRAAAIDKDKQIDVPFSSIDQWEEIRGRTLSYWTAAQWGYTKAMNDLLAIAADLEAMPDD